MGASAPLEAFASVEGAQAMKWAIGGRWLENWVVRGALRANAGGVGLEGNCCVVLKRLMNEAARYTAKTAKSVISRSFAVDPGVGLFKRLYWIIYCY